MLRRRCSITLRWSAAPIPASQHINNMTWILYSESRITCVIQWFLYGFTSASNRSPITVSHQQLITTRHSLGDNQQAKILDQLIYSVYLVVGRRVNNMIGGQALFHRTIVALRDLGKIWEPHLAKVALTFALVKSILKSLRTLCSFSSGLLAVFVTCFPFEFLLVWLAVPNSIYQIIISRHNLVYDVNASMGSGSVYY